jgi:hypothetical protein
MEPLASVLAPGLVAAMAIQQLIALVEPALDQWIRQHKKWILSGIALVMALIVTLVLDLRLLAALGYEAAPWMDVILTALFLTGGTKGFDDLLKWMNYKKEAAGRAVGAEESPRPRQARARATRR